MARKSVIGLGLLVCIAIACGDCRAQDPVSAPAALITGTVRENNINVRSDANTSSTAICTLAKGEPVEILLERYDWYKIRLPRTARVFVKSSFLDTIDEKTAKSNGDNVNIRLQPNQSSMILGTLAMNEVVTAIAEKGEWTKIEPTANTFGWVHKKFINVKTAQEKPKTQQPAPAAKPTPGQDITVEGAIQPYGKVINRIATHKLISKDYSTYLLKGGADILKPLVYHNVRITGKLIDSPKEKYPLIEISKLEALD